MAPHCPGAVIYFARVAAQPVVAGLLAAGGRAVFVRGGAVVLAEGAREEVLLPLERVPLTHGGRVPFQVENALAAVAAAWALGLEREAVRAGLESFRGDVQQTPGRFNVLAAGPATVIVDYAHNPSALEALIAALEAFGPRRRTLVFTGSNRRDAEVVSMGALAGQAFDRVILYADWGNRDRADGELNALLRRGLAEGRRVRETVEVPSELAAIERALAERGADDLVVLGVEAIEQALAFVQARLGASA
jgi:cyanophycin synthetase